MQLRKLYKCLPLIMIILCAPGFANAATLNYNFLSTSVNPGDPVSAEIMISGLGAFSPDSLGAYDIELSFDSTLFDFGSITFGDPVRGNQLDLTGFGTISGSSSSGPGNLGLFEISLDAPVLLDDLQAPEFVLATIVFNGLNPGTGLFGISVNALGDSLGNPIAADVMSAEVTVVPVPAAFWLFGTALIGLIGFSKRIKAA